MAAVNGSKRLASPGGPTREAATGRSRPSIPDGSRKDLIVAAAVDLFTTNPYDAVSIDDVCARAGVAHGLVSYHFQNKRGLLFAAVQSVWSEMRAYQSPLDDEVTVDQRLRGFMRRHFQYIDRHRGRFLLTVSAIRAYPENAELMETVQSEATEMICDILGLDVAGAPYVRASLKGWVGYTHGITVEWLAGEELDADVVSELCLEALLNSIAAPARISDGTVVGDRSWPRCAG